MRHRILGPVKMAMLLASIASLSALAQTTPPSTPPIKPSKGIQAITKPNREVTISFVHPGKVTEILVDVGDTVRAQQLLARQDDTEEQAALAIDESKATDETTINAQIAIRDQSARVAQQMKAAVGGVSPFEIEKAELDAKIDDAKVVISRVQHVQDQLKFKQSNIAIEKLKLLSPIDGIVAQRLLEPGETADGGNMKALRIVQLDPLRIEVPVPILQARKLKKDDVAQVTFSDNVVRPGKVAVVYPVGDAASETIMVRVEVPNKEQLQSGEKVSVNFTSTVPGVAAAP